MHIWLKSVAALFAAAFTQPALAAANSPGTLIAASPATAPAGMQAWSINYWTSDARGQPLAVTGMVVAPAGPAPSRPRDVVAWTHGTWGVAQACAPSLSPKFWDLTPGLAALTAANDVIVAPDYPGLGSTAANPYLIGEPTARSVLDAVRAAGQIRGAAAGRRFAVWGESQGGHAALWTGQAARAYAPELTLVGVAAAAPPTDLAANFRGASDPSAKAFLTGLTAYAWSNYYGLPLTIGRPATPGIITRMAQGCIAGMGKPKLMTMIGIIALRRGLQGVDLAALQPWAGIAAANSPSPNFAVPVMFAQTQADPLVAPAVTRAFAQRVCAAGTAVHWVDLPGGDHPNTARDSAADTVNWLADRFAGHKAISDCGRF
ncbi:MAG: lipase family protein [Sphingomicrobium sp.]